MTTIVHRTPGLIDVRAFTTMGLSAKPTTDTPIGLFGTGLKYAMATLVRLGAEPVVWIGLDKYTFQARPGEFRGSTYQHLRMRRERRSSVDPRKWVTRYIDLPYTLEYGKFWEPWMALRELHSNTIDEGGVTVRFTGDPSLVDRRAGVHGVSGEPDHTTIVVDLPAYAEAWEHRDEIFLPTGLRAPGEGGVSTPAVQIINDHATALYRRGIRALDTGKPTIYTYNFMADLELTEDRTIKHVHMARFLLARFLITSCTDEDVIESIVTADEDHWEHELELPELLAPSDTFQRVMSRRPRGRSASAGRYWGRHDPTPVPEVSTWSEHPVPWKVAGDMIEDANELPVLAAPWNYKGRWASLAAEVVRVVNLSLVEEERPEEAELSHIYWAPPPAEPEEAPETDEHGDISF